jgi:threonylcarbamoyladenosine tRNA methylthiotransferase MtaB
MKTIAFHNLGCKVNAYETEKMIRAFSDSGYTIVPFDSMADIYLVNTCTVTNIADRKSRQMLHRAKKTNPDALVVAVGCYVEADAKRAQEDPAVDLVIGNNGKADVVARVEEKIKEVVAAHDADTAGCAPQSSGDSCHSDATQSSDGTCTSGASYASVVPYASGVPHSSDAASMSARQLNSDGTLIHTRAFLKIQDGCNQFCSYCLIPYVRGRISSRSEDDVLDEAEKLAAAGYKELVLTGIHLSSYGKDLGIDNAMLRLMERMAKIDGIRRIRLGSLEPRLITDDFARELAGMDKLCPHFHLSLQSGSDTVLKRMNRHYSAAEYAKSCDILRKHFTHPAITTDVIVGFPRESEEEFEQTRAFLEGLELYETHIFKYSRRKGTVADRMEGQLTEAVKAARSDILQRLNAKNKERFIQWYHGKTEEALLEEEKTENGEVFLTGYTREYVRVDVPAEGKSIGDIVQVTL